jgi:hypothetical protein
MFGMGLMELLLIALSLGALVVAGVVIGFIVLATRKKDDSPRRDD